MAMPTVIFIPAPRGSLCEPPVESMTVALFCTGPANTIAPAAR